MFFKTHGSGGIVWSSALLIMILKAHWPERQSEMGCSNQVIERRLDSTARQGTCWCMRRCDNNNVRGGVGGRRVGGSRAAAAALAGWPETTSGQYGARGERGQVQPSVENDDGIACEWHRCQAQNRSSFPNRHWFATGSVISASRRARSSATYNMATVELCGYQSSLSILGAFPNQF